MTWSINSGEAIHVPGPIVLGILQDLGWPVSSSGEEVYVSPGPGCGGMLPCRSSIKSGIDYVCEGAALTVNISKDTYGEEINFDGPKIWTLRGGWDSTFDNQISNTIIYGFLTISDGTVIIENIVLR